MSIPRPTATQQLPAGPLHRLELVLETQSGPEGTANPRAPTFHRVQDPISLSPGLIGPCPSSTAAGQVSSSPQPCPAQPQQHILVQPQPWEGAWCPGLVLPGLLLLAGAVRQSLAARLTAVSSTTISIGQKGSFCQQPVRQQKHPGTILAEENRKSSWSCYKAPTATSMAFIYF